MSRSAYFWLLVCHSFHGTFRMLEIGEAVAALIVHVLGYFVHAWKEPLEVVFVALLGLLILTFFVGLFLAAYAHQQLADHEHKRIAEKNNADLAKLRQELGEPEHALVFVDKEMLINVPSGDSLHCKLKIRNMRHGRSGVAESHGNVQTRRSSMPNMQSCTAPARYAISLLRRNMTLILDNLRCLIFCESIP
jgi:hypothetical protein